MAESRQPTPTTGPQTIIPRLVYRYPGTAPRWGFKRDGLGRVLNLGRVVIYPWGIRG